MAAAACLQLLLLLLLKHKRNERIRTFCLGGESFRTVKTMWVGIVSVLLVAVVQFVCAHTIDLQPHSEYCFYEDMHVGDEMTLTYQVSGGGHLDVDTMLFNPSGNLLFEQRHKDTGTYDFTADADGRYKYCFSNKFSAVTDKTLRYVWVSTMPIARLTHVSVSFNVHGVLYLTEEEGLIPAERELRDLANNVQMFKDEQEYLSMRERVHRNSTWIRRQNQHETDIGKPLKARIRVLNGGLFSKRFWWCQSVLSKCTLSKGLFCQLVSI